MLSSPVGWRLQNSGYVVNKIPLGTTFMNILISAKRESVKKEGTTILYAVGDRHGQGKDETNPRSCVSTETRFTRWISFVLTVICLIFEWIAVSSNCTNFVYMNWLISWFLQKLPYRNLMLFFRGGIVEPWFSEPQSKWAQECYFNNKWTK